MKGLICDICGKKFETLGGYGVEDWWVCLKCFSKADACSELHDRWPNEEDFIQIKEEIRSCGR